MHLLLRLVRWLLAPLLGTALLLGGGSWYLAGEISERSLVPHPYSPRASLSVVAVHPGQIVLTGRAPELRRAGTYGVHWATGYGQVTGRPRGGAVVTRVFRLLTGSLPRPGARAGITGDAFPDDPRVALGVPVRSVTYRSPAGSFPAWFVPGRGTTWALLVHGKGATRTSMLRMMRVPVSLGMPSLDLTYRNDAGTPRDRTGHYGWGGTEWEDLDAAVAWAQQHGARRVVLLGASMGGAVVASFLERSPRASLVVATVLDAPVLDVDPVVDLAASRRALPLVGWHVPSPARWAAKQVASLRYGVDWDALDHLDDTSWVRVPLLLLHGTADVTVPFATSARLAAAQPALVTLLPDQGVAHVQSWNHDPRGYEHALRRFLLRPGGTPVARPLRP
ncbi:MAG TPA: alpha/beta hydrolase [Mycobacteriales bacterium]|nr:alpha/beta hydrolase [Mycobacteriales bacterium]